MEKIKQALQKAREQQQRDAGLDKTDTGSVETRDKTGINYSTTKIVAIDPGVLKRNRVISGADNDDVTTAYKILRTQVEQRLAAQGWNSIAVTSPGPRQGKTLTAINLSIALAREMHRTVLLVDLDLRNPSVHTKLAQTPGEGLVDYLIDDIPLGKILINPGIERLVILPAGRTVANSSELIASPKMVKLVDELKSRYESRLIVFDLPPLLSADDALAFSPYVDTTLMVVEDGITTKDELVNAVEMLGNVHLLGTVLNKVADAHPEYAY